ncbi:hypothetical protein Vadar_017761 [Vaccinium darrowii]|uniref:Uncharacterized protein n=1 Tax=Vaccinium darrowii TaxID=229202 RepID=A0ACB7Z5F6_9ERIC|nr:hypothetical protein Vadar_017761 [Vaccinium darrowii]
MGICQSTPTTDQTPNAPVQGHSQDLANPPLVGTSDRNEFCFSCHRPQNSRPIEVEYTNLGDGRYLCPECIPLSLTDSKQVKPVMRRVQHFFEEHLKVPVKKDIPIFFLDANEMNKNAGRGTIDTNTVLFYGRILYSGGDITLKIVKRWVRRGAAIEAVTKFKDVKVDDVATILLSFGLPKQVIGETLAHEMVHALIKLQGWNLTLETSVEEGLCNAVACMWIDYTADDYDDGSFAKKLNKFRKYMIEEHHKDDAEFAKARQAIEKYGLEHTLNCVARTRGIPE